jgi:hypothetical protein
MMTGQIGDWCPRGVKILSRAVALRQFGIYGGPRHRFSAENGDLVKEHQHVPNWLLLFPGIHFLGGLICMVVGITVFLKTRQ